MVTVDSRRGRTVLTLAHVAGMIDMVALPLWIGTLMQHYGYTAPQAGITVTAFLAAVAATSLLLARRFTNLPRWAQAPSGFALGLLAFALVMFQPVGAEGHQLVMTLHVLAGVGVGMALSITHGQIGRSENPHRLFAIVNIALGMFAIIFLAGVPQLIATFGAKALFFVIALIMGVATAVTWMGYPREQTPLKMSMVTPVPMHRAAYLLIGTVVCLCLNQAMVFSFVERIGVGRGFGVGPVNGVLIATGLVNLIPGALAALLQKHLSALSVGIVGPLVQAVLAVVLSSSPTFLPYAVASGMYVAVVIFTHVFVFGLLSQLDASGRTVAATPAMMMLGSCTGPAIGGLMVNILGFEGIGWVASATSVLAITFMLTARTQLRQPNDITVGHIGRVAP